MKKTHSYQCSNCKTLYKKSHHLDIVANRNTCPICGKAHKLIKKIER